MARPRKYIEVGEKNNIVDKYVARMKVYRDFRETNFDKKWNEDYSLYLSKYTTDLHTAPTRSQLFIPMTYWTVENWLTKVAAAFYSGDRIWEIVPRFKRSMGLVRPTQYLLDYQSDIYNWENLLYEILKSTAIHGISWTFFGWDLKIRIDETEVEEPVLDKDGNPVIDKMGSPKIRTRKVKLPVIDQDKPTVVLAHPKEVYWDPRGTDVDNCSCVLREYWQDIDKVKKKIDDGVYKGLDLSKLSDESSKEMEKNDHLVKAGIQDIVDHERKRIKTWDIFEDTKFYTVLNEQYLVKDKNNPLPRKIKPAMLLKCNPIPHELRALSEIDPVRNINIERNTIRNQRIDQVSLDINKMFLVDKNAGIDTKQLYSAPNHFIEVHPISGSVQNAIQVLNSPSVPMSSYTEESMLDNDAQQASGQLDYAIGQTPARREAARTVKSLQTAALQRFEITKIRPLMYQLKRFPQLVLLFDKLYLTEDSLDVRVYNKTSGEYTWETVRVEDIDVECDFRYPGSLGKSMKIERREELRVMMEQAMAYQSQYMSMGGPPVFDVTVPFKYWLKDAEWGELAEEMIIQKHPTETPISPQTIQKDIAAQDKMMMDKAATNPQGQEIENQMKEGAATDEKKARADKMASQQKEDEYKMKREQEKHEQAMRHKQEMHDLEMILKPKEGKNKNE